MDRSDNRLAPFQVRWRGSDDRSLRGFLQDVGNPGDGGNTTIVIPNSGLFYVEVLSSEDTRSAITSTDDFLVQDPLPPKPPPTPPAALSQSDSQDGNPSTPSSTSRTIMIHSSSSSTSTAFKAGNLDKLTRNSSSSTISGSAADSITPVGTFATTTPDGTSDQTSAGSQSSGISNDSSSTTSRSHIPPIIGGTIGGTGLAFVLCAILIRTRRQQRPLEEHIESWTLHNDMSWGDDNARANTENPESPLDSIVNLPYGGVADMNPEKSLSSVAWANSNGGRISLSTELLPTVRPLSSAYAVDGDHLTRSSSFTLYPQGKGVNPFLNTFCPSEPEHSPGNDNTDTVLSSVSLTRMQRLYDSDFARHVFRAPSQPSVRTSWLNHDPFSGTVPSRRASTIGNISTSTGLPAYHDVELGSEPVEG